jgi:hypothetical protein
MSNNKRPLVPAFLQKIDNKLLRNKPGIWQIRAHLVLYFTLLFAAVLSLICFLVFFDARQYSTLSGWVTFTVLVALIGFVFWLIFLLRFNVFKRFGNWHPMGGIKSFALYFISIALIVSVCFIPSLIQTYRANQQFGDEEIVKDINELNATICKMEYDALPKKWLASKYLVGLHDGEPADNTVAPAPPSDTVITDVADTPKWDTLAKSIIDSGNLSYNYIRVADFESKLKTEDSVVKVNDSVYVFYQCPDYRFISSYQADEYTKSKVMKSAELYRTIISNYKKPDKSALEKRIRELKEKWAVNSRYSSYYDSYDGSYNSNDSYDTKIKKKYDLYRVGNGIDNTVDKKYAWKNDWNGYLRAFYYITLVLTLLLFIFRHSTVKTFFLSLLTAVVLSVLTGLFMLVDYSGDETSLLSFIIVYYVVFAAIALTIFGAGVRRAVQGIGLNIFMFMTPFMPVVFLAINDAMHRYNYYTAKYIEQPRHTEMDYFSAEIIGAVVMFVLIELLFKKLYFKWFAAPEN